MGHMEVNLSEFSGKRVFITGDTGFKGSWLAFWLSELGAAVHGYALPPRSTEDHYSRIGLASRISHVDGDIRNLGDLAAAIRVCDPEFVFHLAAQPLVRKSFRDPKETFDTNVGGSVNLLEAARGCSNLGALVFVTSDKCYRNKEWVWGYRETDELGGYDPYSASKAAAEIVLSSYRDSFFSNMPGIGVASARAGNVIGGGDWSEDRIIPDCVRALSSGDPIVIRNPGATRPWQHVLEPLYGYLSLALNLRRDPKRYSGAWNFGPDSGSFKTVSDLVQEVLKNWGRGQMVVNPDPNAPHEAQLLHLNCDKARQSLGWSPRWSFEETVKRTVAWYMAADKAEVSGEQIRDFMGGNS